MEPNKRHCHGSGGGEPEQPPSPATGGETWRGLMVAAEHRCSPYDRDDYSYPQSVEAEIADQLGGMWSPYDGTRFSSLAESDIEHIVATSGSYRYLATAPCSAATPAE